MSTEVCHEPKPNADVKRKSKYTLARLLQERDQLRREGSRDKKSLNRISAAVYRIKKHMETTLLSKNLTATQLKRQISRLKMQVAELKAELKVKDSELDNVKQFLLSDVDLCLFN